MTAAPDKLLLTPADVAAALGISKTTLYESISSGQFAPMPVRFGRCVRYRAEELRDYVRAGLPPANQWRWPARGQK